MCPVAERRPPSLDSNPGSPRFPTSVSPWPSHSISDLSPRSSGGNHGAAGTAVSGASSLQGRGEGGLLLARLGKETRGPGRWPTLHALQGSGSLGQARPFGFPLLGAQGRPHSTVLRAAGRVWGGSCRPTGGRGWALRSDGCGRSRRPDAGCRPNPPPPTTALRISVSACQIRATGLSHLPGIFQVLALKIPYFGKTS